MADCQWPQNDITCVINVLTLHTEPQFSSVVCEATSVFQFTSVKTTWRHVVVVDRHKQVR